VRELGVGIFNVAELNYGVWVEVFIGAGSALLLGQPCF